MEQIQQNNENKNQASPQKFSQQSQQNPSPQKFQQQPNNNNNTTQVVKPDQPIKKQTANILCCLCGVAFNPGQTRTNMCVQCITNQQDISTGIQSQGAIQFCRMCHRYNNPPWIYCERESKEMLSLCLKRISGLNKVKLIDSVFLYTEPHSKRIRIRLTVQKEVLNNTNVQQNVVVEFIEHYGQCEDCKKEFTPHTWGAQVQIRQKVEHKKTFLFLEQIILKNNAHDKVLKVEEKDDGLDFFYKSKIQANKLVEFLQSTLPVKIKSSKQLISHDDRSNNFQNKYVYSLELPRVCKDDLCIFPPKLCKELGGINPLCLCIKISNLLHFVDTFTYKRIDMIPEKYFHYENDIICISSKNNSTEFMVTNCEKIQVFDENNLNQSYMTSISNIYQTRLAFVGISRTSDWKEFTVKSHLGDIVKEGCTVLGYDLTTMNHAEDLIKLKNAPDVVLVKRSYETTKENRKKRIWKVKRMADQGILVEEDNQKSNNNKKKNDLKRENDLQEFLDDIERDPLLREKINLYKDDKNIQNLTEKELQKKSKLSRRQLRRMLKFNNIKVKEGDEGNNNPQDIQEKEGEGEINESEFEDEDDNQNEVKLFELLDDIDSDKEEQKQEIKNVPVHSNFVDDFVKNIEQVKVEKK